MEMTTPTEIATAYIQHAIKLDRTLEQVLSSWQAQVSPDCGDGSVWINVAGGYLHPDKNKSERVKVKKHQMGVVIYRDGKQGEYEIFDIRELWQEVTNPSPKQLALWE